MFRITAHYDDPRHPLQGDVVTVASVAEALAAMPDVDMDEGEMLEEFGTDLHGLLSEVASGERYRALIFGESCNWLAERV